MSNLATVQPQQHLATAESVAPFYFRNEDTGESINYVTLREARRFAQFMARHGGMARGMVCKASGRIVAAWDNGKRSI